MTNERQSRRAIDELVAVNAALTDKIAAVVAENDLLAERVQVTEQERDQFRGWWHQDKARDRSVEEDRKRYEQERDQARSEVQSLRWTTLATERERDAARVHAETMRRQAFPTPPKFPWERDAKIVNTFGLDNGPHR